MSMGGSMACQRTPEARYLRYVGFPSFAEWENSAPSLERWDQAIEELKDLEVASDILRRVRLLITGAAHAFRNQQQAPSEVSAAVSLFRALCLAEPETNTDASLETQLLVCAHMLAFAASNRRLSESWICELQSLICSAQAKQAARAGLYKRSPNRMIRQSGGVRWGAPVSRTPQEMARYLRELRGKKFLAAHPVLQASYSHYSLVLIHPFADGNGRVARSLAGTFLYRSTSIPVLSLNQDRGKYLSALRAADLGNFKNFVNLVQESSIASAVRTKNSILSAMELSHDLPQPINSVCQAAGAS